MYSNGTKSFIVESLQAAADNIQWEENGKKRGQESIPTLVKQTPRKHMPAALFTAMLSVGDLYFFTCGYLEDTYGEKSAADFARSFATKLKETEDKLPGLPG